MNDKIPETLPTAVRAWLTQAHATLAPRLGGGRQPNIELAIRRD